MATTLDELKARLTSLEDFVSVQAFGPPTNLDQFDPRDDEPYDDDDYGCDAGTCTACDAIRPESPYEELVLAGEVIADMTLDGVVQALESLMSLASGASDAISLEASQVLLSWAAGFAVAD